MKHKIYLSTNGACERFGPEEGFANQDSALTFALAFLPETADFQIEAEQVEEKPDCEVVSLAEYKEMLNAKRRAV